MKKIDISIEDRKYILGLLHETKDEFKRAFNDLSKSETIKGERRFVGYWCSLAELAFTKSEEGGEQC